MPCVGFVSQQRTAEIIFPAGIQKFGGCVDGIELHAQGVCDDLINLVPGKGFVGGDLHRLADGVYVSDQARHGHGKIGIVSKRPQGSAVSVNEDRLSLQHTLYNGIAAVFTVGSHRHGTLVIGVAGADDGNGKALFPVKLHQIVFTCNFVPGIFQVGICQGRSLVNAVICQRLLISGGGADKDKLVGFTFKKSLIPLKLGRFKGDKIRNCIEM